MKHWIRKSGCVAAGWLLLAGVAHADEPGSPQPVMQPTTPIDASTVEAWAQQTFDAALERHEFSGLAVSVVHDGQVIFSQGFGRANFAVPGQVDQAATQFRIGSISKTFTATVVAQLLDEGKIASLDDPVNRYLTDYHLPDNNGTPITLHHLLTHTAGFEDRNYFIGTDEPAPSRPDAVQFDALRPAYVRPAGSYVEYSNFGVTLLGRMIEDITQRPVAEVLRTRIFEPLQMDHTELPADIAEPAALGKPAAILPDGSLQAVPFTAINPAIAPAGSIVSTADDMARYMLAQLGEAGSDVVNEHVRELLQTRRAGNTPRSTGLGMVFFMDDWGPEHTVGHGGNWAGFHSWMTLVPAQRTGIFVSVMSEVPPSSLADNLQSLLMPWRQPAASPAVTSGSVYVNSFLGHFLGERRKLPAPHAVDADFVGGSYRGDRRAASSVESIQDLVAMGAGILRVNAREDSIDLSGAGPWKSAGDGAFILDAPARQQVVITKDSRTGASVLTPDLGLYTFTRIRWYQHPRLHAYIALAALLTALAGMIALIRSILRGTSLRDLPVALASLTFASMIALPFIAFSGTAAGNGMLDVLYNGHLGRVTVFVCLANLLLIAALATVVTGWRAMKRVRLAPVIVGGAGLVFSAILAIYHVIGWQLPA